MSTRDIQDDVQGAITASNASSHHHVPHIVHLANESLSQLTPFSGLILTVILIILFLIRHYLLEAFLLDRLYPQTYARLQKNENQRRGFINHHIAGFLKILLLFTAAVPYISVTFGDATLHTPLAKGSRVTMGDYLIVISEIFIAMYAFELLYRAKLSPVAVAHHTGAVIIAQSAIAISLDLRREVDATIEFVLCLTWGAFDVIAEFWPHVAIILYRVYPERHEFLAKVFRSATFCTGAGTIFETIVVMWLFGSLWARWTTPFRVLTPILHIIFSAAQVWGTWNFYKMWQWQVKSLREAEEGSKEEEGMSKASNVTCISETEHAGDKSKGRSVISETELADDKAL